MLQTTLLQNERKYEETFLTKLIKCGEIYDEHVLKGFFIAGSHEYVRYSMQ